MSRVARDAGTVAVVTAAARVVGFLRWLVFAWAVGATGVGTVYQTVNTVPNIVYEIAAGGILAAVVVPLVAHRIATVEGAGADRESADDVASALLTRALAVLLPLTLVIGLGAPLISRALLGDLEVDGAVDLGTRLLLLLRPPTCSSTVSASSSRGSCRRTGASSRRRSPRCSPASSSSRPISRGRCSYRPAPHPRR
ncbi:virulence factor MVIN family protein [Janibacter hoylei PVAS-1]|uniref:Virulence factor MVIN family protein n=1 Tax=Janibacter hoylei PVAS-1 TaxID=1210046 RepID=K1E5A5_9MICO|nr:virulence factor MVIN family protein [Janibacter hoylei PVAS-1]